MSDGIPNTVKEQNERATKLLEEELLKADTQPTKEPTEPPVVEEPPVQPEKEPGFNQPGTPLDDVTDADKVLSEENERLKAELKTWEKRSIEEGRYKKEVEELQEQIALRDQAIAQWKDEADTSDVKSIISDEEAEELGPGYVDAMAKISKAVTDKRTQELEDKLNKAYEEIDLLRNNTQQNATLVFGDRVLHSLGMTRSDYEALNRDPAFEKFLEQIDGFSGGTLAESLDSAFAIGDVDRTVAIHKAFLDAVKKPEVSPAPESAPIPERVSSEINNGDIAPPIMTPDEIATRYAQGQISKVQKDELMKQFDAYYEADFQKNKMAS